MKKLIFASLFFAIIPLGCNKNGASEPAPAAKDTAAAPAANDAAATPAANDAAAAPAADEADPVPSADKDAWTKRPEPSETRCKDGNCACGKTVCPIGAYCIDKHCYCTSGADNSYIRADGFGEFQCSTVYNSGTAGGGFPLLYCNKLDGCKTSDGAVFSPSTIIWSDENESHENGSVIFNGISLYANAYSYYLLKNPDALAESLSRDGDCVLDAPPGKDFPMRGTDDVTESTFEYDDEGHIVDGPDDESMVYEGVLKIWDTSTCAGGKFYCHGLATLPAEKPGDGYICTNPADDNSIKLWVCNEDECPCGNEKCAKGNACVKDVCVDPKTAKGDRNKRTNPLVYSADGHKDGILLELCGRKSAEEVKRDMSEWEAFTKEIKKKKLPESCSEYDDDEAYFNEECLKSIKNEVFRCQVRLACETWNVPRANRNEYVCAFGAGVHEERYHDESYYYPRALGLKCINDEGCTCKNGKIAKGEYCNYFNSEELAEKWR